MEQDDDNEVKIQFLEADTVAPKIVSSIHPSHMYTSKLIHTKKINEASNLDVQDTQGLLNEFPISVCDLAIRLDSCGQCLEGILAALTRTHYSRNPLR
ncbi:20294_t:CDS:2 [Cetraspora pellucida]|uniref:20294_t:CDS:1 n=1 Tax=Cetraspora pellucida TaxID=1433469 RepID=A0A9N8YZJ5_9GLOM|nr:20294_t:CDS:2 [Cetraspora pellucida]